MNKKLLIGLLAFVVLVIGLWLFFRPHSGVPTETLSLKPASSSTQTVHTNQSKLLQSYPSAEEQAQTYEQKQDRYLKKTQEASRQLNRSISFYGRILDQNNQPIANIQIDGHYSFFNVVMPGPWPEQKELEFTSDVDGRFQFEGEKGLSLQLQLQPKEGYEFKSQGFLLVPFQVGAPVISTPDKPYIFHAFKKGETEPLIVGTMSMYDLKPDGRWYTVDLINKRKNEGAANGEFKILIQRAPGVMGHTDLDWSTQIESVNSDVVESNDEFMYDAPESGYVPSWSYVQFAGQPKYKREVSPKFYLKARDGSLYGRIEMNIMADYREGSAAVRVYYWLNPRGLRNLEHDKSKQINPDRIAAVGLEKAIEEARARAQ